jgi:hypothetical protein
VVFRRTYLEEEKQVNNSKHIAFDSKNYTIFDALVAAMQKKREEGSKKRKFLNKLRPDKSTSKKEKNPSNCPHHYGYLGSHSDFDSIPQECLTCQEMLLCRNPDKSFLK